MASLINKARKPKFDLHLTIYDLNNVPLVSGSSYVKWYLPHSMHAEHRGRTAKSAIDKATHRATYGYSKIVPLRIPIDRNNNLTECPIEFEVIQELPAAPGAKDERIILGVVRLNLSEYVEESENLHRGTAGATRFGANLEAVRDKAQNVGQGLGHRRLSSKSSVDAGGAGVNPLGLNPSGQQPQQQHLYSEENDVVDEEAEEGIVRRYLMQDSRINSTLKVGILMVQVDGERNYVAPALKSAPMFGGIAGIMAGERTAAEPVDDAGTGAATAGPLPSLSKSRDVSEVQDMYRRTLAASWACQPGELPADECIEDIFSGGDGWRNSHKNSASASHDIGRRSARHLDTIADDESANSNGNSGDGSPDDATAKGTLKPSDFRRMARRHMRQRSGSSNHSDRSNKSTLTVLDEDRGRPPSSSHQSHSQSHYNLPLRHQPQPTRPQPFRGDRGEDGGGTSLLRPGSQHGSLDNNDGHGHSLRPRRSLGNLAPAPAPASSSSRGRGENFGDFRPQKEVDEHEIREDLVAWYLPGTATAT